MRMLLPTVAPERSVDVEALYAEAVRLPPEGRPWVLTNMVSSLDGAASVEGRTGSLGGEPDRTVFRIIRSVPDVILVGAETVRQERYGPVRGSDAVRAVRRQRGQAEVARLAIVSRSLVFDTGSDLFLHAAEPPLVYTGPDAPADRRAQLDAVAEVVEVPGPPEGGADVAAILADLHERGAQVVLSEGGPTLLGELTALDLVDEWCVTIAPVVVGGPAPRLAIGPREVGPAGLALAHLLEEDGVLLARYLRSG